VTGLDDPRFEVWKQKEVFLFAKTFTLVLVIAKPSMKWLPELFVGSKATGVGKPEVRRPLGRPRRRWEDNIKMDLREVGWGAWTGSG
jgi:hypothetical protein